MTTVKPGDLVAGNAYTVENVPVPQAINIYAKICDPGVHTDGALQTI